jgi:glucokinase
MAPSTTEVTLAPVTDHEHTILAADVGGTKTNIALLGTARPDALSFIYKASLPSADYPSLSALVEDFLNRARETGRTHPQAACFGIPGPIVDNSCETSNLPWTRVEASEIGARFGVPRVALINDLEATAYAIATLGANELEALSATRDAEPGRPRAVIAAGTGLGMSLIVQDGKRWRPLASEGGHVEFAPQSELEIDLLRFLQKRTGHVSVERLLSGPGLVSLYEFFSQRAGVGVNAAIAAKVKAEPKDAPGTITHAAMDEVCPACVGALNLFCEQYGAVAGNLALTAYATGGVYLAGGIAPKILKKLKDGRFMSAFLAKGRLSSLSKRMPVYVVLNELAGVHGAAQRGAELVNDLS